MLIMHITLYMRPYEPTGFLDRVSFDKKDKGHKNEAEGNDANTERTFSTQRAVETDRRMVETVERQNESNNVLTEEAHDDSRVETLEGDDIEKTTKKKKKTVPKKRKQR